MSLDRVIIALDFSDRKQALQIVDKLEGAINFYKVGTELFLSEGERIIDDLKRRNKKIFLDLKFHDIPNTVQRAVRVSLNFGVDMLTLHTLGGIEMLKRARDTVEEEKIKSNISLKLLGVTVLTSLDGKALEEIFGFSIEVSGLVENLAIMAKKVGLDGVVSSANEIFLVKEKCGKDFLVVTPGIRLTSLVRDDQKRAVTPQEAFNRGADYIVVGRAVTLSNNPMDALSTFFKMEYKDA